MKIKDDECQLTNVLYVFNLKVNLLFEKRFTKRNLQENFNDNNLYMHIIQNAEIFKTSARNDIYEINSITFDIDKIALIASIMINENELI